MNKAVFLDKDGTIINNIPYNVDSSFVSIQKETIKGLHLLQSLGFALIIITNQSGIGKGLYSENDLLSHMKYIFDIFAKENIYFSSYYFCPHDSESRNTKYRKDCLCRKPKDGMLRQAINDFNIDVRKSWMIGDILNDIQAGKSITLHTILLNNGNETEWQITSKRKPDFTVSNLSQAADIIYSYHYQSKYYEL